MVNRPLLAVAVTLGMAAVRMAAAKPATLLLGLAGTATGVLLSNRVSPADRPAFTLRLVMVPYTRDWFTLRCTDPAPTITEPSMGAPV